MTDDNKQPEPVDVHVGMAIRRRRRSIGMSQDALAEEMGVTPQQVQKYETAGSRISASRLFRAAQALKAPVSYFFAEIDAHEFEVFSLEIEANVSAFLKSSDGQELAIIFPQIEDTSVRKQFLGLARAMANASQAGKLAES
ncbi:helix-turn-helix domain-containing protein [Asticcacaulis taihuensis]|uniref:helix-turn-helix domain-containing protein n=1 Tax=Asticcacaulis taihuensis TaxID=260084 RepID=UPI003F68D652